MKQAAAVTGLDPKKYHPHLLRHCFSTHCHHNGMPVEVINMLLGRAKLSTTIMYLQVSTKSDDDILQLAASTRAGLKLRNYAFDVPETSAISR